MMALATRYDVRTQVDSSIVAERLPAMCGSETLTTVVSSTSMNVANMTATATSHGLTCGWSGSIRGASPLGLPDSVARSPLRRSLRSAGSLTVFARDEFGTLAHGHGGRDRHAGAQEVFRIL